MGHTEVVRYLYSRGASLDTVRYGGRTPLLAAAFAEEGEETALFLLSTGAVTNQGGPRSCAFQTKRSHKYMQYNSYRTAQERQYKNCEEIFETLDLNFPNCV